MWDLESKYIDFSQKMGIISGVEVTCRNINLCVLFAESLISDCILNQRLLKNSFISVHSQVSLLLSKTNYVLKVSRPSLFVKVSNIIPRHS